MWPLTIVLAALSLEVAREALFGLRWSARHYPRMTALLRPPLPFWAERKTVQERLQHYVRRPRL